MYHYAKPQESLDDKYEEFEKIFNYQSVEDKLDFVLDHFEDQMQSIIIEDLQERSPDRIITSEDFEEFWMCEPDKVWDIIERSYLYDKIISKYFQESL